MSLSMTKDKTLKWCELRCERLKNQNHELKRKVRDLESRLNVYEQQEDDFRQNLKTLKQDVRFFFFFVFHFRKDTKSEIIYKSDRHIITHSAIVFLFCFFFPYVLPLFSLSF